MAPVPTCLIGSQDIPGIDIDDPFPPPKIDADSQSAPADPDYHARD